MTIPALTEATEYVLGSIIQVTEDNELDITKSSAWMFCYPYITDNRGNTWHKDINIRNDKNIRELLAYLSDKKILNVLQSIERNYLPDNVSLTIPHKFVYAFEYKVKDLQHIKSIKSRIKHKVHESLKAVYDIASGLLSVNGKTTQIKGKKQKQLLEILFKNERSIRKRWDQDEISNILDPAQPGLIKPHSAYYTAKNINKNLASNIHVNDLIIAEMNAVKINPKYLL